MKSFVFSAIVAVASAEASAEATTEANYGYGYEHMDVSQHHYAPTHESYYSHYEPRHVEYSHEYRQGELARDVTPYEHQYGYESHHVEPIYHHDTEYHSDHHTHHELDHSYDDQHDVEPVHMHEHAILHALPHADAHSYGREDSIYGRYSEHARDVTPYEHEYGLDGRYRDHGYEGVYRQPYHHQERISHYMPVHHSAVERHLYEPVHHETRHYEVERVHHNAEEWIELDENDFSKCYSEMEDLKKQYEATEKEYKFMVKSEEGDVWEGLWAKFEIKFNNKHTL